MSSEFPLIELRQYLLRPSRRDELIQLFEREFVESQEALGMKLFGLFCDAARPDYFIWMRGFRDMQSRRRALEQFYGGPVWNAHGGAANATMIDSDNVLLLRDAQPGSGFDPSTANVPDPLFCVIFSFATASECERFAHRFLSEFRPQSVAGISPILAAYVTESSANTFTRLPVREGEHHFVAFVFGIPPEDLSSFASKASQVINLVPTRRSSLQLIQEQIQRAVLK
jgi:hypothetical protein